MHLLQNALFTKTGKCKCYCLVIKLCPTLFYNPMDCGLPGSSVHGILQARILEWAAISFCRASSQPRDWTHVSIIGRWVLYHWPLGKPKCKWVGGNPVISGSHHWLGRPDFPCSKLHCFFFVCLFVFFNCYSRNRA